MDAHTAVVRLRARLEATLASLLGGIRAHALIDFPGYPNVGDSAIYLGELACLRALGLPHPRFICDFRSYDREELAMRIGPSGTILLAGGGSFGDRWSIAHRRREEIVRDFPTHRIVQLPQTIWFEQAGTLRRARQVFDAHPEFTLLVRDARSLDIARNEFRAQSLLCPDMALALGPLRPGLLPRQRLLCLLRTDQESALDGSERAGLQTADWNDEPRTLLHIVSRRLLGLMSHPSLRRRAREVLPLLYEPMARRRLRRGLELLASAEMVITDRLHGHILCLLLGLPHVLLDNDYGKLSSFHETWTMDVDGVARAGTLDEALALLASRGPAEGLASRQASQHAH